MELIMVEIFQNYVNHASEALGFFCFLLSALFGLASGSRRNASHRLATLMGEKMVSLEPLRRAMQAKARAQYGAFLLFLGTLFAIQSLLFPLVYTEFFALFLFALICLLSLVVTALLDRFVEGALKKSLMGYLQSHPFVFEDHIALSQEIGSLFGVNASENDTLESFLRKLRLALGLRGPQSKLFGAQHPHSL
jgi:hypothetical protein